MILHFSVQVLQENMGGNSFRFKRFVVAQEGCAMKVGTDGVLLGAWCRIEPKYDKAILDIGTGTGVIALMLAQRTESTSAAIDAVDIDPAACDRAQWNFDASEWGSRLRLHRMPVQRFARSQDQGTFDHIVSNPPYFIDSLVSPDPSRNTARHANALPHKDLMEACDKLLKLDGHISLVLPAGAECEKMIAAAAFFGFFASRLTEVHSTPESGVKRTLIELSRHKADTPERTSITIGGADQGTFSEEYRHLTRDFYLYF